MTEPRWVSRVRAVIVDADDQVLFVENGGRHGLPAVEVERTGEQLADIRQALAALTGVETIVIRAIERAVDEERKVLELALELEPLGVPKTTVGALWQSAAALNGLQLPDDDRALLRSYAQDRPPSQRARWARRGWFAEASSWMNETLVRHGRSAGPIEQVSTWCISSILRTETQNGRVFFKATAPLPLFVDEGTVTRGLATMFPGRVPMPIAVDAGRRWMLLDDFGSVVGWEADLETRAAVLTTFAQVQLESTSRQDELLELGVVDRRPAWLATQIESLLRSPGSLGLENDERERLSALEPTFVEMCGRLAAGAVPDALVHGDLHLSNVAGGVDGYVFFDWTDASLTHPFLDLLIVLYEEDAELRRSLRDAYLGVWTEVAPEDELLELWTMAEPLAALNQAVSYRSIAANVERGQAPEFESMIPFWLRKALASAESA